MNIELLEKANQLKKDIETCIENIKYLNDFKETLSKEEKVYLSTLDKHGYQSKGYAICKKTALMVVNSDISEMEDELKKLEKEFAEL